ncbi:unnamed protein product, partial [Lymnaea stagnalis]
MVLPMDVSSSRHVIQGSRSPPLSTDLSSLIAKLSQNSRSSPPIQSVLSAGSFFLTQTSTTSAYQMTSTSTNLVMVKVLALYNATQIKITSQDVSLIPPETMNQGDVLD